MKFTDKERAVLSIVQDNLPDSLTPYADIGRQCGLGEDEVIALLKSLKAQGVIRRFGASIRHQRSPWKANAMVAWKATEDEACRYAPLAASYSQISHVYFRPGTAQDWPYTLYTMVHGRTSEECESVVQALLAQWPLQDYAILRTVRELKKTSMTYF